MMIYNSCGIDDIHGFAVIIPCHISNSSMCPLLLYNFRFLLFHYFSLWHFRKKVNYTVCNSLNLPAMQMPFKAYVDKRFSLLHKLWGSARPITCKTPMLHSFIWSSLFLQPLLYYFSRRYLNPEILITELICVRGSIQASREAGHTVHSVPVDITAAVEASVGMRGTAVCVAAFCYIVITAALYAFCCGGAVLIGE